MQMKETFYFSHDYNARSDTKIKRLIMKFGMEGYGVFWAIIEDLYQNDNSLPLDCDTIAFELRVNIELVKWLIFDSGLFVIESDSFKNLSVERRLNARKEKQLKARQSAIKRWHSASPQVPSDYSNLDLTDKSHSNANALQSHSTTNALKESKGKYNKLKDNKRRNKTNISNPQKDSSEKYPPENLLTNSEKKYPTIEFSDNAITN